MSEPTPLLDRKGIEEAFRRLGDRLAKRGVVADIYVFGGAAMALAYDSRRATRDVDALFKPSRFEFLTVLNLDHSPINFR